MLGPGLEEAGNDPLQISVRSQMLSAFFPDRYDAANSPKTATQGPDVMSVGLTAKDLSVRSMRDQGDQITEGRFDPHKFETGLNTD